MPELNLAQVFCGVAERVPDRPAVLHGDRVLTFRQLDDRSARLARYLADRGLGCFAERSGLAGHEAGQHLLAQYLHNGPAYVEGLLGSYRARVAPFNVNYRYRSAELLHLFRDARPAAVQYHASFAPVLADLLPELPGIEVLLQVDDGSGEALLPGAVPYEEALASVPPEPLGTPSPDDLYVLYTGGTTGRPKGVLWRQADVAVATICLTDRRRDREWPALSDLLDAIGPAQRRVLPCAPMMHGAAQWGALLALCEGNAVVFPERAESFSAREVLAAVERHAVTAITIVGDAFAVPLIDELGRGAHDVGSLRLVISGGAALHERHKQRLLELLPGVTLVENIGSSESGIEGRQHSSITSGRAERSFRPDGSTVVVSEKLDGLLAAGHDGVGWLARRGRIPLGYLGDPDKTARTFPVVEGVRLSVPGDRARLREDHRIELLGRDSLTINTGGEKVFVEEVEEVLKGCPGVVDAVVCGRPSPRWGAEVAAVIVTDASGVGPAALRKHCRAHLARYKVPKEFVFAERLRRSPAGKADYAWAARQVLVQETP